MSSTTMSNTLSRSAERHSAGAATIAAMDVQKNSSQPGFTAAPLVNFEFASMQGANQKSRFPDGFASLGPGRVGRLRIDFVGLPPGFCSAEGFCSPSAFSATVGFGLPAGF